MKSKAGKYSIANHQGIKSLREMKLKNGQPFMINAKELPPRQAYLEFPDGTIKIIIAEKGARKFEILRTLSLLETKAVKSRHITQ